MPGVDRLSIDLFVEAAKEARDLGIPAIAIFPETDPKAKTPDAREAYNPDNLVCRAITRGEEGRSRHRHRLRRGARSRSTATAMTASCATAAS